MKKVNKIIILILASLALTNCWWNPQEEARNKAFLEKYSCIISEDNKNYTCSNLDNLTLSKTLFKVYNDKYFKDKNAIYKIAEDNKAVMLNIEIRKINDLESYFDLDEDSFEILSDEINQNEYVKDINWIYKLYNYKNDSVKKVEAQINNDWFVELK